MRCDLCENAEFVEGTANIMLEKDKTIIVFKGVPALICTQCGEAYTIPEVTANLQRIAKNEAASGPKDIFMPYVA
jgi:YgiT-type zinc finger domain-containing protein